MKGAQAYVNDQWHSSGLAHLPEGPEVHCVTLKYVIPRDTQTTGLITHIRDVAQQKLSEFYKGREVAPRPVEGSVVGDGSGDGIELVFDIQPAK
ncbi:hypothetical protein EA797_17270 [Stutzerimonas zhaodongensis]|uniref:Uncharacterized protein n=1 Tax=Stutzerimonas zhaodongensis TaxID=1176257 RepID=A0A3M2HKL8_9GAMM|nr:hypothetical protein [Stutzerimonas zhaodongensis]MCQ2028901.1 hypothetical protein [Stutzerimonas zhaodongensis]MCQ4317344.1 hypothetical protein [Stutzerimonas zhaodongensis]RMH88423.1 hypothetical protein EA797_17270 [Stutzerimonas zhaodongensis]